MSKLVVKSQLGNWGTEWGKCGEQEWECEEWDGNAVAGNQIGNLCGNAKNMGNQGDNAGN